MKVSCGICQNRFTAPPRPWFASGGGHMSWKPFVVGVDASPEAAAAAGFACRTAERANAGCRLVHATRDMLAGFEAPQVEVYRQAIVEQARGQMAAVDLSGAARRTLRVAERYAALFGAELRALSVFEPLPVIPEVTPSYDPTEYYAMSEELLHRDIWPAIRMKGVEKVVRYGTAVDALLRETAAWQTDLLVVGSHGKGWATRVLVGSVTERLLNHLPTSLIVVPVSAAQVAEPVGVKLATAMA